MRRDCTIRPDHPKRQFLPFSDPRCGGNVERQRKSGRIVLCWLSVEDAFEEVGDGGERAGEGTDDGDDRGLAELEKEDSSMGAG
jgi:hypothetical protein